MVIFGPCPLVGPLFTGPLFGRTCWTCLNPPPDPAVPPRGTAPNFCPCLLWPNGWMDQDATSLWTKVGLCPCHIVLHGDPAPPHKRGTARNFRTVSIVPNSRPSQLLLSAYYMILLLSVNSIIPPVGIRLMKVFWNRIWSFDCCDQSLYVWLGQCIRAFALEGSYLTGYSYDYELPQ